jgi:hypothetical protein
LWAEGDALAATLRARVDMPLPCRIVTGAADVMPRLVRVMAADAAPTRIDAASARLGELADRLEGALQTIGAIRSGLARERTFGTLNTSKGFLPNATYKVLREFTAFDGSRFAPADLIDSSLLGPATLYRLAAAKAIVLSAAA